ncbi:sensor histidine kinase [Jidongwangia harbinensis]|uniref:sensor histidine kinase n=1 Tax=Jidongwangia harbinensis TaxID=2878561 RepID=UPI001CD932EA|nr:histidine kinase [Jidongwangia harbinensis]MCA2219187.1 histidine kinase [Jidongwangia harbinensis]
MRSLLHSRAGFALGAAALGTGLGVLNLYYATSWGKVIALLMLPALAVRALWPAMPGWLLLAWVTVLTLIGDAASVTSGAYLVVTTAVAVAAAGHTRRLDNVALTLCVLSPFTIWLLETNSWHRGLGAWLWFGGLLIGWGFGHVVARQFALIEELERTRTMLARTAVAEDRQHIARDLHDLVGHSFTVVLLHLSGARMLLTAAPAAPAEAIDALQQAETLGRHGMDELREALMLMHHGSASLTPMEPAHLDNLLRTYREAGMHIDLHVDGDMDGVSAAPRIVLHDVLREALTNVAKHARPPETTVRIGVDHEHIDVRIENALGPVPVATGAGMGLAGLDHRVAAIGGTFHARPDHGCWVVRAQLPRRLGGAPT